MPLFDQFGQPIQAAKPRFKKKARPKNIPRKRRPSELGALHRQAVRDVTVTLLARHNVNGMTYGPGQVTVKRDLADALNEAERNARQADENFAGTKAVVANMSSDTDQKTSGSQPSRFLISTSCPSSWATSSTTRSY